MRLLRKLSRLLTHAGHYTSTACMHDEHSECRRQCKFCSEECACPCHKTLDTLPLLTALKSRWARWSAPSIPPPEPAT